MRKFRGEILDEFLGRAEWAGFLCSPWALKHLYPSVDKLAEKLSKKFGADQDDVYDQLNDLAHSCFHAGFDFCLNLQKALRAFADGDVGAIRPFVPNPYLDGKPAKRAAGARRSGRRVTK